jgi:CDP-diacylglycerol pyrophosphatase
LTRRRTALLALMLLALGIALWVGRGQHVGRDALRQIVQQQCLPHWRAQHVMTPCLQLSLSDPTPGAPGYAVLADRKGGAHFLLIPTQTLTGIEDPRILSPDTINYFEAAWQARANIQRVIGHEPQRGAIGLAVNSQLHRSQDQLHIHIACLQPNVYQSLQRVGAALNDRWSPIRIAGSPYQGLRLSGQDLGQSDPFQLLAQRLPGAEQAMGAYTLVVAGMQFQDGPGFIVLAGRTTPVGQNALAPGADWARPGETLLDGSCAVER